MDIFPPHLQPRQPRLGRRRVAVALGTGFAGAAGLAAALVWARTGAGEAAPPAQIAAAAQGAPVSVEAIVPETVMLARVVPASGSVSARDELLIGCDASGVRLVEVLVEVGARVVRGQLLARGDDSALRAQLAQHDALIRQAEVELEQAAANLDRAERIRDSGVYSAEAVQTRSTAARAAAAKLDLVKAQRRELEVHLSHTRVLAPADGVIARRTATVGAVMQPGLELFRLIRDEQLEWLAELPAGALAQVQVGATARLHLEDGRIVEGQVRLVAPTIDPRTRNGLVHVALPRSAGHRALRAGGHASGEIVTGQARAMALPESVVFVRDGESFVHVIGPEGVARRQRVQTGVRQGGRVEVAGLAAGARVVSTGAGFVKDGERVHVGSQPAAGQGAAS